MLYLQRVPSPPLDAFVAYLWYCRRAPRTLTLERVLPSSAAQLIVNLAEDKTRTYECNSQGVLCHTLSGAIVSGASTRFEIIDTAEQENAVGVAFRPGGTLAFTRLPACKLSNTSITIEDLFGREEANCLREQLLASRDPTETFEVLEGWLRSIFRGQACHPAVSFALKEFHTQPTMSRISAVKDVISLSPRRFIERFEKEVGITPKRYCRLLRFQHIVSMARNTQIRDWAQLAAECGYFDQAHFIHEFREFSGLTPNEYLSGATEFQNHVTFLQST